MIEDMNCSFNRLIEKGNNLTAERDRYKAEALAAKQLCKIYYDIASSVLSEDEIRSKRDDAINKIKEG